MRKTTKSDLPGEYWAEIPVHDPKTDTNIVAWIPFLLIHETMAFIFQKSRQTLSTVCQLSAGSPKAEKHKHICKKHNVPEDKSAAIGMHTDGVPFANGQTVEVWTWNFIAIPHAERILFTLLEKQYLCRCGCHGRHTTNAVYEVLVYCMVALLTGKRPPQRHDKRDWLKTDKKRAQQTNAEPYLNFHAFLEELRCDWAAYKQVFGFGGWNAFSICWRCFANREDIPFSDFSLSAAWRSRRHTTATLMALLRDSGVELCTLFSCPAWCLTHLMIDCLHTLDLGFSQDCIGNIMWEWMYSGCCAGNNKAEKLNFSGKKCDDTTRFPSRQPKSMGLLLIW